MKPSIEAIRSASEAAREENRKRIESILLESGICEEAKSAVREAIDEASVAFSAQIFAIVCMLPSMERQSVLRVASRAFAEYAQTAATDIDRLLAFTDGGLS